MDTEYMLTRNRHAIAIQEKAVSNFTGQDALPEGFSMVMASQMGLRRSF